MNEFSHFGLSHFSVFVVIIASAILLSLIGRKNSTSLRLVRLCLISLCNVTIIFYYVSKYYLGWLDVRADLPMHLCDWALICCVITLIHPNQITFELSYFWGLGGTLQALITPELQSDFPDISFFIFFSTHSVVIITVIFLVTGFRFRPYPVSVLRVFLISQLYLISALIINITLDANYGFLQSKPDSPSLLDFLGPHPVYIFSLEIIAFVLYVILYLPFFIRDKLRWNAAGKRY